MRQPLLVLLVRRCPVSSRRWHDSWRLMRIQRPPHASMIRARSVFPSRLTIERIMALHDIAMPIAEIRDAGKRAAKR